MIYCFIVFDFDGMFVDLFDSFFVVLLEVLCLYGFCDVMFELCLVLCGMLVCDIICVFDVLMWKVLCVMIDMCCLM